MRPDIVEIRCKLWAHEHQGYLKAQVNGAAAKAAAADAQEQAEAAVKTPAAKPAPTPAAPKPS